MIWLWFNMCLLWYTQIEYWLTCGSRETDTNKQTIRHTYAVHTRARACGRRQRKVHWSKNTSSSIDHLIIGYWMNWYVNSREKCILFFKEDRINNYVRNLRLQNALHVHTVFFFNSYITQLMCVSVKQMSVRAHFIQFLPFSKLDVITITKPFFPSLIVWSVITIHVAKNHHLHKNVYSQME